MVATDGLLRLLWKKEEGETLGEGVVWHQEADGLFCIFDCQVDRGLTEDVNRCVFNLTWR